MEGILHDTGPLTLTRCDLLEAADDRVLLSCWRRCAPVTD